MNYEEPVQELYLLFTFGISSMNTISRPFKSRGLQKLLYRQSTPFYLKSHFMGTVQNFESLRLGPSNKTPLWIEVSTMSQKLKCDMFCTFSPSLTPLPLPPPLLFSSISPFFSSFLSLIPYLCLSLFLPHSFCLLPGYLVPRLYSCLPNLLVPSSTPKYPNCSYR